MCVYVCVSIGTCMPCHDTHMHIHVEGRLKDNFRNLFLSAIKESRDQAKLRPLGCTGSVCTDGLSGRPSSPLFTAINVVTGKGKITCATHVTSLLDGAAPSL